MLGAPAVASREMTSVVDPLRLGALRTLAQTIHRLDPNDDMMTE
jgi:hypothetical protein